MTAWKREKSHYGSHINCSNANRCHNSGSGNSRTHLVSRGPSLPLATRVLKQKLQGVEVNERHTKEKEPSPNPRKRAVDSRNNVRTGL